MGSWAGAAVRVRKERLVTMEQQQTNKEHRKSKVKKKNQSSSGSWGPASCGYH